MKKANKRREIAMVRTVKILVRFKLRRTIADPTHRREGGRGLEGHAIQVVESHRLFSDLAQNA